MDPRSKIKSLAELKAIVRLLKEAGKTVVFANGCFDLLHVGHVRYLRGARAMGDALVVGVNGDACVKALKGEGRPLQGVDDRAEMIASMTYVDYVLIFDTLTVDGMLDELRPDIHAKGTDYCEENVPERATVLSYGGKVAIAGDPKDHSTRDMIETIVSRFSS
ncbi:MAG: adenylyltransferase/cytidyltransferase family protein [Acidobacteria bacterium]|nr:adenylyltransferase/cytidyltransferase family protein [Acidobacteriota bacterium]